MSPTKPIASTILALDSAAQEKARSFSPQAGNPHTSRPATTLATLVRFQVSRRALFCLNSVSPRPSPSSRVPSTRSAPDWYRAFSVPPGTPTPPSHAHASLRPRRPHTPKRDSLVSIFIHSPQKIALLFRPYTRPLRPCGIPRYPLSTLHIPKDTLHPAHSAHNTAQSFYEFCSDTNIPA